MRLLARIGFGAFVLSGLALAEPVGLVEDVVTADKKVEIQNAAVLFITKLENEDLENAKVTFAVCNLSGKDTTISRKCADAKILTDMPFSKFQTRVENALKLEKYRQYQETLRTKEIQIREYNKAILNDSNLSTQKLTMAEVIGYNALIKAATLDQDATIKLIADVEGNAKNAMNASYVVYKQLVGSLKTDDGEDDTVIQISQQTSPIAYTTAAAPFLKWRRANLCYCGKYIGYKEYCVIGKGSAPLAYFQSTSDSDCTRRDVCASATWKANSREKGGDAVEVDKAELLKTSCNGYFEVRDMEAVPPPADPPPTDPKALKEAQIAKLLTSPDGNGMTCSFQAKVSRDNKVLYEKDRITGRSKVILKDALESACQECTDVLSTALKTDKLKDLRFLTDRCFLEGCENGPGTLDASILAAALPAKLQTKCRASQ